MIYEIDNNYIDLRHINAVGEVFHFKEYKTQSGSSSYLNSPERWEFGIYLPHADIWIRCKSSEKDVNEKRDKLIEAWKISRNTP